MRIRRRKDKNRNKNPQNPITDNMDLSQRYQEVQSMKLGPNLEQNLQTIQQVSGYSFDVKIRRIDISQRIPCAIVYIENMVKDSTVVELLRALMIDTKIIEDWGEKHHLLKPAIENLLVTNDVSETDNIGDLFAKISLGYTALLMESQSTAFVCDTFGAAVRNITEPTAETTIRGPREGFVESLAVNTTLIRRQIRVPHLWIETVEIGSLSKTKVAFAYIKGLADEKMLTELRTRLNRIDTDTVLESGYIEEFIEDQPLTLFPLLLRTERPDKVCSSILEGKVAILTDGTPHVLIMPAEFTMFFMAPDDYYEKMPMGSFIRILRYFAAIISIFLPGFYVAIVNFHQELLPTALLLRVTATREGVPFPVVAEVLIMEVLFEILREAGIRLPSAIGSAISIVGALVLGEAAIRAGMVSPAVVIVIALTAIASFSTPAFSMAIAIRIIRFAFILLAAVLGMFGMQFGILLLIVHLCSLRSLGIPYMSPIAPFILQDMGDTLFKTWFWAKQTRPKLIAKREPYKQRTGQMPHPGKDYGQPDSGENNNE